MSSIGMFNTISPPDRKFPNKLWKLVSTSAQDEDKPMAITWTRNGESIMMASEEFEKQYLHNANLSVFKTGNISSFVRQLNLYGFKKHGHHRVPVSMQNRSAGLLIYSHPNFKRDRPELLKYVSRKAACAVRNEARAVKASKNTEITSKTRSKRPRILSQMKDSSISPDLQNARNHLNEVLDRHYLDLVASHGGCAMFPGDPCADMDHIGAEEIIGKLQYLNRHSCCFVCEFL